MQNEAFNNDPISRAAPPVLDQEIREMPRNIDYQPPRRRGPGVLAVSVVGLGLAAAVVSSFYDPRTLMHRAEERISGNAPPQETAVASDAEVTAAVKAALAKDPALDTARIEVSSEGGVVRLDGPAPDGAARERAQVLAAASPGVARVDNRLTVLSGDTVTR